MDGGLILFLFCFNFQIYEVFIEPNVDRFILLVALAPSIAGFALAFLTRPFPPEFQDEDNEDIRQRFRLTYVSASGGRVWHLLLGMNRT
jgi:hypothetical protein